MSKIIVFQGDSITDAGRNWDDPYSDGQGYPLLVKAALGLENPGDYVFYNRGVSGNRIPEVYDRREKDLLDLKPDYLSILIGVNDIWHGLDFNNATGEERYAEIYDAMLGEIQEKLPDAKIMILEPFVLRGYAAENTEEQPDRWQIFNTGVHKMAEIARKTAEKHGVRFVELQSKFDKACESAPIEYWLSDGVHPTPMGHELIKREWIKAFKEL